MEQNQPPATSQTSTIYANYTPLGFQIVKMDIDSQEEYPSQSIEIELDDQNILSLHQEVSNQESLIEAMKLDLQNEQTKLIELRNQYNKAKITKRQKITKSKVTNLNKRRLESDEFNEELDELRNQRPPNTCQYVNASRNRRCTKKAVREIDDKEYCEGCCGKVLLERYNTSRGGRR
jgi:hypothetical protein